VICDDGVSTLFTDLLLVFGLFGFLGIYEDGLGSIYVCCS
jgi:hypothetical protein